jgi:hypothetical protein
MHCTPLSSILSFDKASKPYLVHLALNKTFRSMLDLSRDTTLPVHNDGYGMPSLCTFSPWLRLRQSSCEHFFLRACACVCMCV